MRNMGESAFSRSSETTYRSLISECRPFPLCVVVTDLVKRLGAGGEEELKNTYIFFSNMSKDVQVFFPVGIPHNVFILCPMENTLPLRRVFVLYTCIWRWLWEDTIKKGWEGSKADGRHMLSKVRALSIFKDSIVEDLCPGNDITIDSMTKEIFL